MNKRTERIATLLLDILTINLAYVVYYLLRVRSGWIDLSVEPELTLPMIVTLTYWILLLAFFGLYRSWYARSRMSELFTLFNTTVLGTLLLFFVILLDDLQSGTQGESRILIFIYWFTLLFFVSIGRISLRAVQRKLLERGIGVHNTLIAGCSANGFELCEMALKYPALGFKIVGFVTSTGSQSKQIEIPHSCNNIPILGEIDGLPELIKAYDVKELLVGLESSEHTLLTDIIRNCEGNEIGIKIMPDMYDIVSGQARISSIYGFPLMEVAPELMKPWEESLKRLMDIVASILILAVGMPLWLLNSIVLKANSKGPLFYRQMRVGKNGRLFKIIKFRSMVADAEKKSGPVWADKNDPRVTSWGRFMRKTHIDEVPQFINVLIGDMSLVGPRPERPEFVESLSQEIPLYKRRLRVRPGITGWAQVKYSYDQSIEDVKNKLKYDLFYIENVSWRLDLIILFHTFYVMLRGKGHT